MGIFGFGKKKQKNSKDIAKDRLKLVLVHDRVTVSPRYLDQIKNDMIGVISTYMDIVEEEIDIKVSKQERSNGATSTKLVANIPIRGTRGSSR